MKKTFLLMMTCLLVIALLISGCAQPDAPLEEPEEDDVDADILEEDVDADTLKVGLVLPTMNVFYLALKNGVEEAVTEAGGITIVVDSQQYNVAAELASVEDLLQQRIDVLIIDASDKVGSSAAIEAANAANVPVIGLNQRTESGEFVTVVASENYEAGRLAAEFVMEQIGYSGQVAIINGPPVPAVLDRIDAFEDVVASYPDVEIVSNQMMGNTLAEGITVAENMLQANPDLAGYLCMNDFAFLGALSAIQSVDKVGEIAIGAIDGMPEVVQMLAAGLVPKAATAAQLPAEIGRAGVQAYLDYVAGRDVPNDIRTDVMLITKENAAGFSW